MEPKAYLADCETCPLRDQPFVGGSGPDQAEIVVCAEAPGQTEVRTGIPLIGKSGQLFNKVLEQHGIERESTYVTNAVLCRPEDNRTPTAKELRHCRDRLIHEIKQRKPKTIIALGAVASKDLLKTTTGIKVLRMGGPTYSEELDAHVIATFHPAAALRSPDLFPSIINDVKKARTPVNVGWEPTKYHVSCEAKAADDLKYQLEHAENNLLSLDIEVAKPYDRHRPSFLCIGIAHRPGQSIVYPNDMSIERIKDLLNQGFKDKRWLMQNGGKVDIQNLWGIGVSNARVDEDSLLAHYATDERKGTHDLEQMATELLGAPFYKTEARKALGKDTDYGFLDPKVLHEYNATDADVTYRLFNDVLLPEMHSDGTYDMYRNLLIPGSQVLSEMEYRGVRIDTDKLDGIEADLRREAARLEVGLAEFVENPRSPAQVKAALEEMGYPVQDTTAATLKDLEDYTPFARQMLDYRTQHKMLTTYVNGIRKKMIRGRVHSTFLLHGTETGRLSSRQPNLQNVPVDHPVRECYIPDEGCVFIDADYGQIELRVAAALSGDDWLLEQFRTGQHIHKAVAIALFGENYTPRQYITAKSLNFGVLYGETPGHLSMRLGMSMKEAKDTIDNYFKRSPGLLRFRKEIEADLFGKGYLTSYFGRKRRFWLITRDNKKDIIKEAYNFPVSSVASDINLTALIRFSKDGYVKPVLTVHDNTVFNVPEGEVEEASRYIEKVMVEANPFDTVPVVVDIDVSSKWKMKEA